MRFATQLTVRIFIRIFVLTKYPMKHHGSTARYKDSQSPMPVQEFSYSIVGSERQNTLSASPAMDRQQAAWLQGVSRTFALTIPVLPMPLQRAVANAYLLCRIIDTIEDEPTLDAPTKRYFCDLFCEVVAGQHDPCDFAHQLSERLSDHCLAAERDLVRSTAQVIAVTHSLHHNQRQAMQRCIAIMSRGMADFQERCNLAGLRDISELNHYCYCVAGVVGELLTSLFCDHSPTIAKQRDRLMSLAIAFGQGLQMTNILKDQWEDRQRGTCWLPQDLFADLGVDLSTIAAHDHAFRLGINQLIAITRSHLRQALTYTLLIPRQETGIRCFCLWALGMAVLTLRNIHRRKHFRHGRHVKISRLSVRTIMWGSRRLVGHDQLLTWLFNFLIRPLPH